MFRFLLSLVLVLCSLLLFSKAELDSLQEGLPENEAIEIAEKYTTLYWKFYQTDLSVAYAYATEGLEIAKATNNVHAKFGLSLCLANYYSLTDDVVKYIKCTEEALQIAEESPEIGHKIGLAYLELGYAYRDYYPQQAFAYLQVANKLDWPDDWLKAKSNFAIASLYKNLGNKELTKQYFYQAYHLYNNLGNQESVNYTLFELSQILIEESKYDSALFFIEELETNTLKFNWTHNLIEAKILKWHIMFKKRQFGTCMALVDTLYALHQSVSLPKRVLFDIQLIEARTLISQKKFERSLYILYKVRQSAKQNHDIKYVHKVDEGLLDVYKAQNNNQMIASIVERNNILLKDSIVNIKHNMLNEISAVYEYMLEKDSLQLAQERERLFHKEELVELKAEQIIIKTALGSVLIIAVLLLFFFIDRQKNNFKLKKTNLKLKRANLVIKNANNEIATINNELEIRVIERTQALEKKNNRLESFASYNSHILRAPVARFLGLISLLRNTKDKTSTDYVILLNFLYESAEELNKITHEMQAILEIEDDEDFLKSINVNLEK